MRDASTYRGARRNAAREMPQGLVVWRVVSAAAANSKAKLDERREQCADAQHAAMAVVRDLHTSGVRRELAAMDALRSYWLTQERSRVVSRILLALGPAKPAKAAAA